jgi:hypothetical protein
MNSSFRLQAASFKKNPKSTSVTDNCVLEVTLYDEQFSMFDRNFKLKNKTMYF